MSKTNFNTSDPNPNANDFSILPRGPPHPFPPPTNTAAALSSTSVASSTGELGVEALEVAGGAFSARLRGLAQVASFVGRVLVLVVVDVGCEGQSAQVIPGEWLLLSLAIGLTLALRALALGGGAVKREC